VSRKALVPINVLALEETPAGQYAGDLFFNTTETALYTYTGAEWLPITTGELDGGAPTSEYAGLTIANGGTP
jgi:hypothetical protein